MQLTYESVDSLGRKLLLIKKKNIKYNQDQVLKVLELLENEKLHPQEIAKQTEFSARQIKKLRYIKKHMIKVELDVLLTTKYYISSIEKYIKSRIKKERNYNDSKRRFRK